MELRCIKVGESTLQLLDYRRNEPAPQLVKLSRAVANRESTALWVLLVLTIVIALALVVIAMVLSSPDHFLNTRIVGREGGSAVLWMILVAVAGGSIGFLVGIWYSMVKIRTICADVYQKLPYCIQVPMQLRILSDTGTAKFSYRALIDVAAVGTVKLQQQSWIIMNSGTNVWKRPHDPEVFHWLSEHANKADSMDAILLVDSDGEPAAIICDNRILWLVTERFFKSVDFAQLPEVLSQAKSGQSNLRQLVRAVQQSGGF